MENDTEKYSLLLSSSFDSLYQRFYNEVLNDIANGKCVNYLTNPEVEVQKVDLLAGWKFSRYVLTN